MLPPQPNLVQVESFKIRRSTSSMKYRTDDQRICGALKLGKGRSVSFILQLLLYIVPSVLMVGVGLKRVCVYIGEILMKKKERNRQEKNKPAAFAYIHCTFIDRRRRTRREI